MKKNSLDTQYQFLLKDILDNGKPKDDRTGTGTISVFGRTIRHNMSEGFPLLTTKKMAIKSIMVELKWFLKGDTNIQYLVQNGCNIWNGDAYKNYCKLWGGQNKYSIKDDMTLSDGTIGSVTRKYTLKEFIEKIKTDDEFAKKWGELGPIYGKQWRNWTIFECESTDHNEWYECSEPIDQIKNALELLKTDPDSRRNIVSSWNVGELDEMILPPCHNFFQVYTRELTWEERRELLGPTPEDRYKSHPDFGNVTPWKDFAIHNYLDKHNIPKREISLLWNQRSVDTPLGLPFNIASYGMLLTLIAHEVNMIPGELIGNLGDTHIYKNQVDGCKEQIGRELTLDERFHIWFACQKPHRDIVEYFYKCNEEAQHKFLDDRNISNRTLEPFQLPTVKVSNVDILNGEFDYEIENYQSHPSIKFPLSN